jgi:hypothetical protein
LTTGHTAYANSRKVSLPQISSTFTKVPMPENDLFGEDRRLQAHPARMCEGTLWPIFYLRKRLASFTVGSLAAV